MEPITGWTKRPSAPAEGRVRRFISDKRGEYRGEGIIRERGGYSQDRPIPKGIPTIPWSLVS
jgi:hypothetical protein